MIEKRTIEVTDLEEVIFLINHEVPIFMELAAYFMHIKDDIHPWGGGNSFFLSGKAERDFDILCKAGAIGGLETGKSYLARFCLWDSKIHGEQPAEGKALAKKFGIGEEFVDFAIKREGIKEYIINGTDPEDFLKDLDEQAEQAKEFFNKPIESKAFKHKYIGTCDDGRVKVKITCHNEWLEEEVSIIINDDQLGISPFPGGYISKLEVTSFHGNPYSLFGFFASDLLEHDECLYIGGIVDTLKSGATNDFFGEYSPTIDLGEGTDEGIKPIRELNLEDIKNLLKDPEHILVVDAMSCENYIYTSGQRMNKMVEQIHIDNGTSEQLQELVEANVIFYGGLVNSELKDKLAVPQFYDLWYEDIYGPQPDEGYQKAKLMGLETNTKD
jgi:hypothetical protein